MIENPQHFSSSNESLLSKHKWWKLNIRTNAFGFHLCYANYSTSWFEFFYFTLTIRFKYLEMSTTNQLCDRTDDRMGCPKAPPHVSSSTYNVSWYKQIFYTRIWILLTINLFIWSFLCFQAKELCSSSLSLINWRHILKPKYKISTAPMIERPERSPMVPPIADNMSTNLAASSLVILSNVVTSK